MLAAAVVAAVGALILGEYPFTGAVPLVAGALFGLAVGEVATVVARDRGWPVVAPAAAVTAGGLLWAGWISDGPAGPFVPSAAYAAAAIGAAACVVWARTARTSRSSDESDAPAGGAGEAG